MFRNLRTGQKIMILVCVMLVLQGTITFIGFRINRVLQANVRELFDSFSTPAVEMSRANTLARNVRQLVTMAMLSDDEEYLRSLPTKLQEAKGLVEARFEVYRRNNLEGEGRRETFERMARAKDQIDRMYGRTIELAQSGKKEEALDFFMLPESRRIEEGFFECIDQIVSSLMREAAQRKESDLAAAARSTTVSIGISLFAILTGGVMGILIARAITKPVGDLKNSIDYFSKGDLTVTLESKGKDEMAQMGAALGKMSVSLNQAIGAADGASRGISGAAREFSSMAEETSASVQEFRANIDEMSENLKNLAVASERMNASVQEVAVGAQVTAEKGTNIACKVDNAMSAGDEGMKAVQTVVEGIGKVVLDSVAATDAIKELGNRAREIQDFVTEIGGVADQTNLLALNAAIEAARAGDAGKGFAVVAEEVRKLAEDSNVAARNIAALASTITADLEKIIRSTQENVADSDKAKNLSFEAENAIEKMLAYLRDIAGSTQDLAAVAQEQAASSQEIAESTQRMIVEIGDSATAGENIRTSVAEVATASERVALEAERLSSLSGNLQEELSFFKLAGQGELAAPRRLAASSAAR